MAKRLTAAAMDAHAKALDAARAGGDGPLDELLADWARMGVGAGPAGFTSYDVAMLLVRRFGLPYTKATVKASRAIRDLRCGGRIERVGTARHPDAIRVLLDVYRRVG